MIHVLAIIELAEGTRDAFLREFHAIVPAVRDEEGCMEYGPTIDARTDLPQQLALGESVVTIVEKWSSMECLKAHLVAPHMMAYRERVKPYVKHVRLHILQPV
jgi:quinol monooxygenase YgiN